jgi:Opacity protein and related surface antigens
MKKILLSTLAAAATMAFVQPAMAQSTEGAETGGGTGFRGVRVEGNFGGDRFQSEGNHDDNFGFGGTVGFDGTVGERIVIGAEGSYWRSSGFGENCTGLADGNSICHKAFEEWGAAVRAGYLVTPDLMLFGKAGYVNSEQRRRIDDPVGTQLVYDKYRADGYQVGGGVEYDVVKGSTPVYANLQYVYSNYHGNSARQRVMAGVGVRFK